jgi:hypothetical protein
MNTTHEAVPTVWTAQDEDFFRVVSTLLAPAFLQGASALLASYDADADSDATAPDAVAPLAAAVPQARLAPGLRDGGDWPLAA